MEGGGGMDGDGWGWKEVEGMEGGGGMDGDGRGWKEGKKDAWTVSVPNHLFCRLEGLHTQKRFPHRPIIHDLCLDALYTIQRVSILAKVLALLVRDGIVLLTCLGAQWGLYIVHTWSNVSGFT